MMPSGMEYNFHSVERTDDIAKMSRAFYKQSQRGSTVEQLICNQWVAGSIPVAGSTLVNAGRRAKTNLLPAFLLTLDYCFGRMHYADISGRSPQSLTGMKWRRSSGL